MEKLKCQKCKWEWWPKDPTKKPIRCPNVKCSTAYWENPKIIGELDG